MIHIVDTEVVAQTLRRLELESEHNEGQGSLKVMLETPGYRAILERGIQEGVRETLGVIVQAYGMVPEEE